MNESGKTSSSDSRGFWWSTFFVTIFFSYFPDDFIVNEWMEVECCTKASILKTEEEGKKKKLERHAKWFIQ